MEGSTVLAGDLLEEILSRLPVRQLLRLRLVCKSWCSCIDDSRFKRKHFQLQCALRRADGDMPIYIHMISFAMRIQAHSYILSKQQEDDVICDLTHALQQDSALVLSDNSVFLDTARCAGVVNGVVLLVWRDQHMSLWNPATREFKVIPNWPIIQESVSIRASSHIMGLGFDPATNDFKVVGYLNTRAFPNHIEDGIGQFEMYSLSTNSWKKLRGPPGFVILDFPHTDSYLNGVHYWAGDMLGVDELPHSPSRRSVIVSFNFSTEVFKVYDPPQHAFAMMEGGFCRRIALYKDSLAWIVRRNVDINDEGDPIACCFDVWVVTKFDDYGSGDPLSWQRLFTIGPVLVYNYLSFETFRMDGDVILTIQNTSGTGHESGANLYNPSMCTFKKLGLGGFSSCFRYIESLSSFSSSA